MPLPLTGYAHVAQEVLQEIERAKAKHPGEFHSGHEGFAILKEEVDELWDEVKLDGGGKHAAARKEAIQIAAMAIRYAVECTAAPPED